MQPVTTAHHKKENGSGPPGRRPILCVVIRQGASRRHWVLPFVLAAALMAAALATGVPGAGADSTDSGAEPRLPTVVNAPGTWSDEVYRRGPVAAVGLGLRTTPVGLSDDDQTYAYFATSALDGRSSWLDLPGFDLGRAGMADGVALSPDGRWVGWVRAAKGRAIKGWSIRDNTTGKVRNLDVEGHDRVRSTWAELAFSGDSKYLLTSYELRTTPKDGRRNHQFVAWNVEDGTAVTLEEPGFYSLPSLGSADQGVVWSRNKKVFRADSQTGQREEITLPHDVMMASWAPDDAAFAYIGRDKPKKKGGPADEYLYVGATPATADRVVDLPDTSPIGGMLAWRDQTHVVVGNYRRDAYVVDITDGSVETFDLGGSGEQINDPLLATNLWAEPLREPVAPTDTNDPRQWGRWAGAILFLVLLGGGAIGLRRVDQAARSQPPSAVPELGAQPDASADRVPAIAWVLAWLFLADQVVRLMARGPNPGSFPWVVVSMLLTALVVRWVAAGVLRARTVRLALVWILLSAAVSLGSTALLIDARAMSAADLVSVALTLAQLVTLFVFCRTSYFKARRARPDGSDSTLAPLLLIAVVIGLLGGLTAATDGEDVVGINVRIGL